MYHFNNTLCISGPELIKSDGNPQGFMSAAYYNKLTGQKSIEVVRRGCKGTPALISVDSLPTKYQDLIKQRFGDPDAKATTQSISDLMEKDLRAVDFFTGFRLEDGRALPNKNIAAYINDASILNGFKKIQDNVNKHKAIGAKVRNFWPKALAALPEISERFPNSLPNSEKRLRETYEKYVKWSMTDQQEAYRSLISRKFMNDNSRKVTALVEKMILSLYTMPVKPFGANVYEMYHLFLNGKLNVVDKATGEYFERDDFKANGQYIEISESTVWNYLNNPLNRAVVDKSRMDILDYNNTHRPHHRRHAPNFSFSKVSMDDRDLPRKMIGGDRVKAYYAYDVASGAVVGASYSRSKDEELFLECLQNMFRLMDNNDWGVPMEIEVENHLVNKFFDDLAMMFPLLRICAPGNSQEKHAEHFNKAKKYGTEKKTQVGMGRWWAKSEAYRVPSKKVNNEYVERLFTFDALVADDKQAVRDYNNAPHPKQKKYPGMSRWQVLCMNINPNLSRPNRALWIKSIGKKTETSIKRSGYVRVNYAEYRLPGPKVIERLKPNNYNVDAYWLEEENGQVPEIHIYQQGEFICTCAIDLTYNTAKGEWIDTNDAEIMAGQAGYVAQFDKMIKDGRAEKLVKPVLITAQTMQAYELTEPVKIAPSPIKPSKKFNDDAENNFSGMSMAERAIQSI